jgi:hypothetical protein
VIKTLQQYKFLSIFIVSIHLVYFLTALYFEGIYTIDSPGYLFQAQNLVNFHSVYAGNYKLPLLADYFAFRPPFYGYFIVVCKFFYQSDYSVLFAQNIIAIVLIFYVLHFVNKLGVKSKIINLCFPICLIFYPAHFVYTNTIMSDSIFEAMVFALFYQTYYCFQKPSFGKIMVISFVIAISMITKPVSILIGLLVCLVLLFAPKYPKIYLAPVIILPLLAYFSFGYAVKKETGYFQFTSMKSFVAVRCLVKYSAANAYGANYSDSLCAAIVQNADAQPSLADRFNYIDSSCNQFLLHHKMAFFKTYLKGCLTFIFDPGRYDLYKLFNANNDQALGMYQTLQQFGIKAMLKFLFGLNFFGLLCLAILAIWNTLVAIVFVLFFIKSKYEFFLKLLIAMFVLYFLFTTGVLGVSRYRVHIFPILLTTVLLWANQFLFPKTSHD